MRTTYKLENLGCANCANKMEEKISALPGVEEAHINFLTLRLRLKFNDSADESTVEEIQKIISKIEPDCKLITSNKR